MGQKSFKVPQPQFSNWVIKRRQALNLSSAGLREKLNYQLSDRTLKYLEGGKKETFSEHTLSTLAKGLDLGYPELLQEIDELNSVHLKKDFRSEKSRANRIGLFLLTIAGVVLLSFWLLKSINNNKGRLQDVLIHNDYPQIIVAYDSKGSILWQKNLQTKVKKVALFDIDQDGHREVIAGTWKRGSSDWGDRPGWLFVWNEKGKLITEQNMLKPSIYPAQEPHINIIDFEIVDLDKDGSLEIVAMIRGVEYYPSRLAILHFEESAFKEVKTYWNPGYLLKLFIEDIDGDGFPEIFCAAVNNDVKRVPSFQISENVYSMFMLQGKSIYGQAPPYLGKAQKGSQVWYRYITPPSTSSNIGQIVGVRFMGAHEKEIHVKLRDLCFFYLNYEGEIIDRFWGDSCRGETELHLLPNDKTR